MEKVTDIFIIWGLICTVLLVLTPICSLLGKAVMAKGLGMTISEYRRYEKKLEEEELNDVGEEWDV